MTEESPQNEPLDRFEARRQRREERRAARAGGAGGWIFGIILVLLGVVFLFQNLGFSGIYFNNWWALFILIPAIAAFERGVRMYREAGNRLDGRSRGAFFSGLLLLLVTVVFLFNLDWTYLGPVLLILLGAGVLATGLLSRNS